MNGYLRDPSLWEQLCQEIGWRWRSFVCRIRGHQWLHHVCLRCGLVNIHLREDENDES
jgi:hypothetical protein